MPKLINETMTKIIQNAPYEEVGNNVEETKTEVAAAPEEVKIEFPAEKPWLKKKKTKVYDSNRYTQQ